MAVAIDTKAGRKGGEKPQSDEKRKRKESDGAEVEKGNKKQKFSQGGAKNEGSTDKKEGSGKKPFKKDKFGKHPFQKDKFGKKNVHNKPGQNGKPQQDKGGMAPAAGFEETVCLCCRKRGHTMAHCPQNPEKQTRKQDLICFRCGEKGHGIKTCSKPKTEGLTFAMCFICKEKGHISRDCPQNTRGIYPKGGSCKICGDVWHLAKDCPEKGTAKDKKATGQVCPRLVDEDLAGNAEYDAPKPRAQEETESNGAAKKKKARVVKFERRQ